jgi:hypothetical protein
LTLKGKEYHVDDREVVLVGLMTRRRSEKERRLW